MLTNKEDGAFTISELEVWEVTGYMKDQFVKYDSEEVNPIREERKTETKEKLRRHKSVNYMHLITLFV